MKRLLGLLAATGLVASTSITVVACSDNDEVVIFDSIELSNEKLSTDVKNITIAEFIEGKDSLIFESNAATGKSIITTSQLTKFNASTLKTDVKIGLKEITTALAQDINEEITIKYENTVLGKIVVKIKSGTTNLEAPQVPTINLVGAENVSIDLINENKVKAVTISNHTELGKILVTSNNTDVASVSESAGTITLTGVGVGSAKITVSSSVDGVLDVFFNVQILDSTQIPIPEIILDGAEDVKINLSSEDKTKTVVISNYTELGEILVTSNNTDIATVSEFAGTITLTGVGVGITEIIVSSSIGEIQNK
ncbi:hypothetical protein SCLARK_00278 [Spiroplasma clarkii]|uniref:BIG2 domain-containing protein n=2 Tax=Spiroplasma clarkii TaxID=2139 RepID=A0A1Y0KZV5_9MOLU|nr:lipoprotein [Spiroplasma clarkii]ARU91035.1 hypothetical protein SCLARK_00278 [Spiroplasma clarkii]ATX70473.1 hypothetical protein SCLAR_v1c01420 [Spiroplasma clarkii]